MYLTKKNLNFHVTTLIHITHLKFCSSPRLSNICCNIENHVDKIKLSST